MKHPTIHEAWTGVFIHAFNLLVAWLASTLSSRQWAPLKLTHQPLTQSAGSCPQGLVVVEKHSQNPNIQWQKTILGLGQVLFLCGFHHLHHAGSWAKACSPAPPVSHTWA